MAKKGKNTEAEGTEADGQATTRTGGGRAIVLTLSQEVADRINNGSTEMKRVDYIRARADEGATRREITNELTELQGKEIAYQIVFAATKDHPAYPKGAKAAPASDEGTEEAA